jgi:hypothetical protein
MAGGALVPWATLLIAAVASVVYGPMEGYLAGLMVGPGAPIVVAFARVLRGVGHSDERFAQADTDGAMREGAEAGFRSWAT